MDKEETYGIPSDANGAGLSFVLQPFYDQPNHSLSQEPQYAVPYGAIAQFLLRDYRA
ncbi:uncharacterized protein RSE6_04661 [Rhynchosporium secalis]|uniref:Uncharacterized protein n=1 Tax=Rhynchosporium secalis TaxID=38038 RepID=A0A1E1M5V5_RHYSE|nr:uncharacterized protein RSE6_04661 [Rhynchosporium secalis]